MDLPEYVEGALIELGRSDPSDRDHCLAVARSAVRQLLAGTNHASDCSTHNEPAYPNGPCDCGASLSSPSGGGALEAATRACLDRIDGLDNQRGLDIYDEKMKHAMWFARNEIAAVLGEIERYTAPVSTPAVEARPKFTGEALKRAREDIARLAPEREAAMREDSTEDPKWHAAVEAKCPTCGGGGAVGTGTPSGEGGEDCDKCPECDGTGAPATPAPLDAPGASKPNLGSDLRARVNAAHDIAYALGGVYRHGGVGRLFNTLEKHGIRDAKNPERTIHLALHALEALAPRAVAPTEEEAARAGAEAMLARVARHYEADPFVQRPFIPDIDGVVKDALRALGGG